MSKRFILLSLVALILLGSVTSSLADTANTAKTLTLDEAYDLALKNNIDFLKAGLSYDQAMLEAEQADYNADKINSDSVGSLQEAQTKYVSSKQKLLAEEVAKQTYDISIEQTKNLVEKNYYDVLKAENLIKTREAAVKRAQEQFSLVQKKYKAGTAVKTDVNRAEVTLANAKADLANAQRDFKNTQVAFTKVIGLDVSRDVKLAQILKYEKVALPTVEELTKQALVSRLDLKKVKNAQTIAQINYDLVIGYQAPNTFTGRSSKIDLERAKLDLLQQEQNVKAEVISTLFQIQKSDEVVQLLAKGLEQAKDNYSLAQRRYQIGVGSAVDVISASVDLADSEAKYVEAVYNYALAKNQLKTITIVSKQ